jgi:hypothetical protein
MAVFDHGMDVAAVAESGGHLVLHSTTLNRVTGEVSQIVGDIGRNWEGFDKQRFVTKWQSHVPVLNAVAKDVMFMGTTCLTNAGEQGIASL